MMIKLNNVFKYLFFACINFIIHPSKKIRSKSLLLIRLDAIGDYILFRNFIEALKKSEKYKNYSITLLGNNVWQNLSEELDREWIDEFIWLDRNKFHEDFMYRYKKLRQITLSGYEVVLSPVYSREFFYADTIVKLVFANEKIGSVGNAAHIRKWQKTIYDQYYDRLLPTSSASLFEFDRNREFFENLLDVKLHIKKPYIKLEPKELSFTLPPKYAILFIGASVEYRKWSIEGFARVGMWLKEKYGYEIVLCGAPSDTGSILEFKKYFKGEYINFIGRTSLIELLHVISNGNLMVANETSAPHMAVALEMTNIFVISNGNHYGRFTPYPEKMAPNYHAIYHPDIEKDLNDYQKLSNSYGHSSSLDIHEISFETVQNKMREVLHG